MVDFTRCKDCKKVWNKKIGIKEPQNGGFGLSTQGEIFINSSLCSYYKILRSKSKKLEKIYSFHISNNTIKIKISENSSRL